MNGQTVVGTAPNPKRPFTWSLVFWIAVVLAALAFTFAKSPLGLPIQDDLTSKLPNLLGSLLVVALFVERVIEIFVSIWRDPETDLLEQQREGYQKLQERRKSEITALLQELSDPNTDATRKALITNLLVTKRNEKEEAEKKEEEVEQQLVPYEARTRRIAAWVGLALGTITAAVGFRFLYQITNITALSSRPDQASWFAFVDVLLTGAVLAGGSKAIHYIFALYGTFMETTRQRADKGGN